MLTLIKLISPQFLYTKSEKNIIQKTTLFQAIKKLQISHWTTELLIDEKISEKYKKEMKKSSLNNISLKKLQKDFNILCKNTYSAKISTEVGFGIFARKKIPKNSYFFYPGRIYSKKNRDTKCTNFSYSLSIPLRNNKTIFIDAEKNRNITTLFQHFPTRRRNFLNSYTLTFFKFKNKNILNKVATANCKLVSVKVKISNKQFIFVHCVKTLRNIRQGEQLGYDYGLDYWTASLNDPLPHFFDTKTHKPIPRSQYTLAKMKATAV